MNEREAQIRKWLTDVPSDVTRLRVLPQGGDPHETIGEYTREELTAALGPAIWSAMQEYAQESDSAECKFVFVFESREGRVKRTKKVSIRRLHDESPALSDADALIANLNGTPMSQAAQAQQIMLAMTKVYLPAYQTLLGQTIETVKVLTKHLGDSEQRRADVAAQLLELRETAAIEAMKAAEASIESDAAPEEGANVQKRALDLIERYIAVQAMKKGA